MKLTHISAATNEYSIPEELFKVVIYSVHPKVIKGGNVIDLHSFAREFRVQ
jgi:hypothetical protein